MKYIYILNRFNLKNKSEKMIKKLRETSEKHERDYQIIINENPEDAKNCTNQFQDTEYIITSIGGDGSINLLLNDLIHTKNILSFIPYGTGNDFYRFCKEKLNDGIHEVDIVKINERYFINVACFGIDADIANDDSFIHNPLIPSSMRYNAGVVYYFLSYHPRHLKIEVDDQIIDKKVTTAVIGNAQYYGGGYHVSPYGDIKDGFLELIVADKLNKIAMAKVILSMKDAGHLKPPAVSSYKTKRIVISCKEKVNANIDGEALEADRFEIEVLPKAFKIDFDNSFIEDLLS